MKKPTKDLLAFWEEIQNLNYISMVTGYEDNKFSAILKRYGLKKRCQCCMREIP